MRSAWRKSNGATPYSNNYGKPERGTLLRRVVKTVGHVLNRRVPRLNGFWRRNGVNFARHLLPEYFALRLYMIL